VIIFENKYENLFKPCYSCKSISHKLEQCPFLHFITNNELLIKRHIYTEINERKKDFQRKKHDHVNTLKYKSNLLKMKEKHEKSKIFMELEELLKKKSFQRSFFTDNTIFEEDEEMLNNYSVGDGGTQSLDSLEMQKELPSPRIDFNKVEPSHNEESKEYKEEKEDKECLPPNNLKILVTSSSSKTRISSKKLEKLESKELKEFREVRGIKEIQEQTDKIPNLSFGNVEFEREFLSNLSKKRRILIQKDIKSSEFVELGTNLFNFNFEQPKHYIIYNPANNLDNNLKKYKAILRNNESKKKRRNAVRGTKNNSLPKISCKK